jgi:hypothetical protein
MGVVICTGAIQLLLWRDKKREERRRDEVGEVGDSDRDSEGFRGNLDEKKAVRDVVEPVVSR